MDQSSEDRNIVTIVQYEETIHLPVATNDSCPASPNDFS